VWTEDLADFWEGWRTTAPGPHVVIGHSMGGHLVLRTALEGGIYPDALILSAPMLGFDTGVIPSSWAVATVRQLAKRWPERLAWPDNEKPSLPGIKRQTFLTHDNDRYADELHWRSVKPDLVLGPPSLSWLAAANQSTLWTAEAGRLERLQIPTLIVGTDADALVSPKAIREFARRIPNAELLMFGKEARHEVLRETDLVRDLIIAKMDQFLKDFAPLK
jgi:lysophospholipase